jgi:hypothetical protein
MPGPQRVVGVDMEAPGNHPIQIPRRTYVDNGHGSPRSKKLLKLPDRDSVICDPHARRPQIRT